MRVNLKVPFAQKDAAKELGARWDAARKLWYVIDPDTIEVFADWMPEVDAPLSKPLTAKGVLTGPKELRRVCECQVLPWDHCPHSVTA